VPAEQHRRLRSRWLAATLSTVVGLLLSDGFLRLAGWPAPGYYLDGHGPLPLRLPGKQGGAYPSGHGRLLHYDYDVACDANTDGFRERERTPKTPGEWRIGILGNSFAAGVGVEADERFPSIWFGARPEVGNYARSTLWNLSTPWCSTHCEAEIAEAFAPRYELDELILVFYGGSDLAGNMQGSQIGPSPPVRSQVVDELRVVLRENCRLCSLVWIQGLRSFASFSPAGVFDTHEMERVWPATKQALDKFAAAAGSRPVSVWYLPPVAEWSDTTWAKSVAEFGYDKNARHLARNMVAAWAAATEVAFVDLGTSLRDSCTVAECMFSIEPHLNARGHVVVAQGLLSDGLHPRP